MIARTLLRGSMATVSLVIWIAAAAGEATAATCHVRNRATRVVYQGDGAALQTAIDEAGRGADLLVSGRCVGAFAIDERIALIGRPGADVPRAAIVGDGSGSVLTTSGLVNLMNLRVVRGNAEFGGGIHNTQRLVLDSRTRVVANEAELGGGIFNEGSLIVRGHTRIRDNVASRGGGIYHMAGRLRLAEVSSVRSNRARDGGGVFHEFDVVVAVEHASIRANHARRFGGGIYGSGLMGDTVTLEGQAAVVRNRAGKAGGGVYFPTDEASVFICSPAVRISPNVPDDPPTVAACG